MTLEGLMVPMPYWDYDSSWYTAPNLMVHLGLRLWPCDGLAHPSAIAGLPSPSSAQQVRSVMRALATYFMNLAQPRVDPELVVRKHCFKKISFASMLCGSRKSSGIWPCVGNHQELAAAQHSGTNLTKRPQELKRSLAQSARKSA